jgi:heme exporter protein B
LNLLYKSFLIFQKDVKEEFRTRYNITTIFLFSFVTVIVISFSAGVYSLNNNIKCILLWIILFFSSMTAQAQVFIREEEAKTGNLLKLISEPLCIFVGKLIYNFLLLITLELIILPLYSMLMSFEIVSYSAFIFLLLLGSLALSIGATFIAAIISKTNAKGALFSVVSLPILLPVLITAINGMKTILNTGALVLIGEEVKLLFAYIIITLTASILLFDFIWKE